MNLYIPPSSNFLKYGRRTTTSSNSSYEHQLTSSTWKRQVEIYLRASGTTQLDNETQTATIINCGGEQLLTIFDNFTWDDTEDVNDPTTVFKKIEEYCNPRKNEVAESHQFWSVKYFAPLTNSLQSYECVPNLVILDNLKIA